MCHQRDRKPPKQGVSSAVPEQTDSFVTSYLRGELADWFCCPTPPTLLNGESLTARPRSALAAALAAEATRLGAHPDVVARSRQLAHPSSRAVVTGQQAGLLLGPLFTVSKAATVISIADEAGTDDAPVVPVFWLASQDHDAAEVDHAWLLDMNEELHRVAVDLPAGVAVGSIPFRREWLDVLTDALAEASYPAAFRDEVTGILERAAQVAESWADFFTATFYAVFGASAPVVLDPSRASLAPLFEGVLAREIEDPLATSDAINEAGARLKAAGHPPQLGRAAGATNLFLAEDLDGSGLPGRNLLRYDGKVFTTAGGTRTRGELLEILRNEPGRITPAAGLRPVTQDAVLPTAALVVGPGELRYLAQLRGVYEHHGVAQPTIWPRTSVTVIEPPVRRILDRYGLSATAFRDDPEGRLRQVIMGRSAAGEAFERSLLVLERERASLLEAVSSIDPTLAGTVLKHADRIGSSISLLRTKTGSALARNDTQTSGQFRRLANQLLPASTDQERQLSPFSFFAKFGTGPVMRLFDGLATSGHVELDV